MFNPLYCLSALLMCCSVTKLTAQSRQISVTGTYAPIISTINATEINYTAFGVSGEYEYKSRKHWSFGVELDWQKYTPEIVHARPIQPTSSSLKYTINRYQVNLRPIFRYYWKEDFQGFYVGAFGVYARTITLPKESPEFPGFPSRSIDDAAYQSAAGFGVTYGYRFKLTPSLRLSVLSNHQLVFSDLYDDDSAHQDHQFGLGLNWFWEE